MAFTSDAIKAFVAEYGNRLKALVFDNSYVMMLNVPDSSTPKSSDIVYKEMGEAYTFATTYHTFAKAAIPAKEVSADSDIVVDGTLNTDYAIIIKYYAVKSPAILGDVLSSVAGLTEHVDYEEIISYTGNYAIVTPAVLSTERLASTSGLTLHEDYETVAEINPYEITNAAVLGTTPLESIADLLEWVDYQTVVKYYTIPEGESDPEELEADSATVINGTEGVDYTKDTKYYEITTPAVLGDELSSITGLTEWVDYQNVSENVNHEITTPAVLGDELSSITGLTEWVDYQEKNTVAYYRVDTPIAIGDELTSISGLTEWTDYVSKNTYWTIATAAVESATVEASSETVVNGTEGVDYYKKVTPTISGTATISLVGAPRYDGKFNHKIIDWHDVECLQAVIVSEDEDEDGVALVDRYLLK